MGPTLAELDKLLTETPWTRLGHAFGDASDLPALLLDLRSSDVAVQRLACEALGERVCHQGSRYQVGAHVVPFLVHAAVEPTSYGRDAALALLGTLLGGFGGVGDPFACDGETCWTRAGSRAVPVLRGRYVFLTANYRAVSQWAHALLPLCEHDDPDYASPAAALAGLLLGPGERDASFNALRRAACSAAEGPRFVATLALGLRREPSQRDEVLALLAQRLEDDGPVATAAALSLADLGVLTERAGELLLDTLEVDDDSLWCQLIGTDEPASSLAERTLARLDPASRARLLERLVVRAAQATDAWLSERQASVGLALAFGPPARDAAPVRPGQLTSLQRRTLGWLLERLDDARWDRVSASLDLHGLPAKRGALLTLTRTLVPHFDPDTRLKLAEDLFYAQRFDEAHAQWSQLELPEAASEVQRERHLLLGVALSHQRGESSLMRARARLVQRWGWRWSLLCAVARQLVREGHCELALELLARASAESQTQRERLRFEPADVLLLAGRYEQALAVVGEATEPTAQYRRAHALLGLGRTSDAALALRALASWGDLAMAPFTAVLLSQRGDWEAAFETLRPLALAIPWRVYDLASDPLYAPLCARPEFAQLRALADAASGGMAHLRRYDPRSYTRRGWDERPEDAE